MDIIKTSFKLLIITVVASALLGAVNSLTRPIILENERLSKEESMMQTLPADSRPVFSQEFVTGETMGVTSYYIAYDANGEISDFVIFVTEMGDQGKMVMAVGLKNDGTVNGIKVVTHTETPGLGANTANDSFLSQFTGKTGPFVVVKNGVAQERDILAVTSATHSSAAVVKAANDAIAYYEAHLRGEDK